MRAAIFALAALRLGLRLELGPEFDSNANRSAEQPPAGFAGPAPSFLLRGTARGRLTWLGGPHQLRLSLDGGGKYFFAADAASQQTAVLRFQLEHRSQLHDRFSLGAGAEYHDAFQPVACPDVRVSFPDGSSRLEPDTSCHRDFRLGVVRLVGLLSTPAPLPVEPALGLEASGRGYEWKPDADLSFLAPALSVTPSLRLRLRSEPESDGGGDGDDRDVTLSMTGRIEWRAFAGPALRDASDLGDPSSPRRADLVGSWAAQVAYSGPFLAQVGYVVEVDRSNSYGGSYLYQGLTMGLTMPMPAKMTASIRAQLLFFSRGTVARSLAVDEENRDSLVLDLSREMGAGFTLRLRYAAYRNGSSDLGGGYFRQLAFFGATWERR